MLRLKGRKRSVYYYTELKESDFYKLNALNIEGHDPNLEKIWIILRSKLNLQKK